MVAHNAETIFNEFQRLRDGSGSLTAEERLATYCREVLTSVERLHFDYKTKRNSQTPQLDDDDRKNLAKGVSGFANSGGGGVLLWGIKGHTRPILKPIAQIETFMANLLALGGQAIEPSVLGIDGAWIPSKDDSTAGYAAIFVPESSLPPHRVILKVHEVQHHYYMRTGSSFIVATHSMLEDMFGRRPRPKLVARVREEPFPYDSALSLWYIVFDVVNEGRGTAKEVFIRLERQPWMKPPPVGGSNYWKSMGESRDPITGQTSIVYRLQPPSVIHPGMTMAFKDLSLSSSSEWLSGQSLELSCTFYCEGSPPTHISIEGTLGPRSPA